MDSFEVLVPIKPLTSAKQRLSSQLDATARAALVCEMLANVLGAAAGSSRVAEVFVVTTDGQAAKVARGHGARILPDAGLGLNAALEAAVLSRLAAGARALAILQGDLPWLCAPAVDRLLDRAAGPGAVVVAPDQHGRGTSALAWRQPVAPIRFAFGRDSLARHARLFDALAPHVTILEPDPAFRDLDDLRDLVAFRERPALRRADGVPA